MSTVHARIKKYKKSTTAHVIFRIKDGKSIDINYTSEIEVDSEKWDNESEGYPRKVILNDPQKEEVNQLIISRLRLVKQVYESSKHLTAQPTTKWLKEQIDTVLFKLKQQQISTENDLIESFENYIETYVLNKNRKNHFHTVLNSFKRFITYQSIRNNSNMSIKYNDINYLFLNQYYLFLQKEHDVCLEYKIQTGKPISKVRKNSTLNGYLKKLRTFLYHYKKANKKTTNPFEGFLIASDKFGTPLHLTVHEFEYLQKVIIDNPRLNKIRDVFVLNCLVGFRVSDFFNLKHSDIIHGCIEYYPSKTLKYEVFVKVPLLNKAKEIILKYKTQSEYIVPRISLKTYNNGLKELFEYIGLDRMITYLDSETNQTAHAPLFEKISSHCARRTFISGLVVAGVSDRIICTMTGHKPHSREISRYYTIDGQTQKNALKALVVSTDFPEVFSKEVNLFSELKSLM